MKWKILSPDKIRSNAVAKLDKWRRAKTIAEKRGAIPESANPAFVVRSRMKRVGLSEEEQKRLDSELNDAASATDLEGREEKIKRLLEAGADVNTKHGSGWTPLMSEARYGPLDTVMDLFIDYGAELNLQNNEGDTALHIAAMDNNTGTAEILLEAGADPHIKNKEGKDVMDVCVWVSDSVAHLLEKQGIPLPAGFDDPDEDVEDTMKRFSDYVDGGGNVPYDEVLEEVRGLFDPDNE